jgi:flagellar biosynthesis/type III secretory pathway protein FliH
MLAERVLEWTQEWKQEGFQEGLKKGLEEAIETLRSVLLAMLEQRFGPLPEETRRRAEAITSIEVLAELVFRSGTAPSLEALGLF